MRPRIFASLFIALALLTVCNSGAASDSVWATRHNELSEQAHTVRVKLHKEYADLNVRRVVRNTGSQVDEANFEIMLPSGAVATALRTPSPGGSAHGWRIGKLVPSEAANEAYYAKAKNGSQAHTNSALLRWNSRRHLALQLFPCLPQMNKAVEYSLRIPTVYRGGRFEVELPFMGHKDEPARVTLVGADGQLRVDGEPKRAGHSFDMKQAVVVGLTVGYQPRVEGRLAAISTAKHGLNQLRFRTAPKLSVRPRRANVVLILDESHTNGVQRMRAAREAAVSYLQHLPDARVEVITFARHVQHQLGGFVKSERAIAALRKMDPKARNGSFVDAALREAVALLRGLDGPKRIVVFTDTRVRLALTEPLLRAAFSAKVLTHVVSTRVPSVDARDRPTTLTRYEHDWSPTVGRTGGVLWSAAVGRTGGKKAMEELVRPLRLHDFSVTTKDFEVTHCPVPETLDEGEAFVCHGIEDKAAKHVLVEGMLWAAPVRLGMVPNWRAGNLWAALAFGAGDALALDDNEMLQVAKRGRVVSPATSYLAIKPGIPAPRPTSGMGVAGAVCGGCPAGLLGYGTGVGSGVSGSQLPRLKAMLGAAWVGCGGAKTDRVAVTIETDRIEVADITDLKTSGTPAQESCLNEALWKLRLPGVFRWEHRVWRVSL